jgi:catechol 2,3-dioxygenase-like lactoylglutathione lyase family enzyme
MTAVAEGTGIRAMGIAEVTLTSGDLARARVFYIVRLGFPLLLDETDMFAFSAGKSAITVRRPSENSPPSENPTLRQRGIDGIVLWCTGDELRRVAEALTAAGVEHSGVKVNPRLATEHVAFEDPDGIGWELRVG